MSEKISDYILYKDHHLVCVNKPAGIPSQADKEGEKGFDQIISAYCKQNTQLLHRLDRPVSGVLCLPFTKEAQAQLQAQWDDTIKIYLALIPKGLETNEEVELIQWIGKQKQSHKAMISEVEHPDFKQAILSYQKIHELDKYDLLKVYLKTGRFHQIRAQLAHIGFPVKGDVKYGARRSNEDRSIGLHAYSLSFLHPLTRQRLVCKASLPQTDVWRFIHQEIINSI